jgi:hypothetical protein
MFMAAAFRLASGPAVAAQSGSDASSTMKGTWSGTFFSNHENVPPFSMTVVITPNSQGHLTGSSSLNSECLKGAKLELTMNGSDIVLAGSDDEGDSITLRGSLDDTGTQVKATYILNGSASGRCETDDGTGSLAKK